MCTRRTLTIVCATSLGMLATPARAQDVATAKALFTQGLADMEAGNFEKGCPALEGSYKLDPRPGTMFTLAECEKKRGRLAAAEARYDDYLSLYARMSADQQKKQGDREKIAREQRAALGPEVPKLTLMLPPDAPTGTVVKRDGTELVAAALGVTLPVDPGEHVVTTQAPGGPVAEQRVTLGRGETKQLTLTVKSPPEELPKAAPKPVEPPHALPPAPSPDVETAQGTSGRRTGAYIVGGVGLVGLIASGVMGGLALSKKSESDQNCHFADDPKGCNDAGIATIQSARSLALGSTISFGVGAAGAVTAAILLLTEPRHKAAAARGVRGGVLSAGREGVTVGFQGPW